jgi:hypothetical protein
MLYITIKKVSFSLLTGHSETRNTVKQKLKQSRYRPGVAQRVPVKQSRYRPGVTQRVPVKQSRYRPGVTQRVPGS